MTLVVGGVVPPDDVVGRLREAEEVLATLPTGGSVLVGDRRHGKTSLSRLVQRSAAAQGAMVGHGGIVVFDETVDMAAQARFAMEFCAIESCGKCTPCRIGAVRGVEVIDKIVAGIDRDRNLELLDDLCTTMVEGSLCAMGGLTPSPVMSAVKHFPEDFDRPVRAAAE